MNILSVLRKDAYKVGHPFQYPDNTELVYSNVTPRASRVPGVGKVVVFGIQAFIQRWLVDDWQMNFFERPKDAVLATYKRRIENMLGPLKSYDHIADLHELGYLPLTIKALPEGTLCPLRVPFVTLYNTHRQFGWLTNSLETHLSSATWRGITSATTAYQYRKTFERYAALTGTDRQFVKWQGHDFSMRGMDPDAGIISGAAHLLSFTGTDTIPAIDFLEQYYGADCEKELIGGSVPATEHSVMCIGGQEGEIETFRRLITETYPSGIVSVVSDTWDFWKVLTDYLPQLREEIQARDGKLVIRPDSGDPVKIICGDPEAPKASSQRAGAIRLLYEVFGGTRNSAGYIELNPKIGLIYGDSITRDRQTEILQRLATSGFASGNVVLGIGSYTYAYVTRDTYGQAIKATYGEVNGEGRAIFKKPATDDGLKDSAKGLLRVVRMADGLKLEQNQTWEQEQTGELKTVFHDGGVFEFQTLQQIRNRIEEQIDADLQSSR
jgi:nicotinamide phosphoribosyltransferase